MSSNFDFLKQSTIFESFATGCLEAEKTIATSASASAILSRRALELAVRWVYTNDGFLHLPYQDNISSLIHERTFREIIDDNLFPMMKYIITLGNQAAHSNRSIKREDAILSLHNLHQFVSWIDYCYSDTYTETKFNEKLLPVTIDNKASQQELEKMYKSLGEKDKKLSDTISENEKLREELRKVREENTKQATFNVDTISEFETRKRYIDLELREAGWEFGEDCIEEHPVKGMPFGTGNGYVDYVLFGKNGHPLGVVEAKKTSKDPKVGQQQAKLYADCLEKITGQRPVIFYTNGFETYLWDDISYPERMVSGFYTKDELQLMVNRRTTRASLDNIKVNAAITDRYYQKEAIKSVCDAFQSNDRKALLVMATGSGKTRVAASLVDVLARHDWVKNVLFLADRTALVRQAKGAFNMNLESMSLCNLVDSTDNPESRVVFSTYPTMMNAIDDTKSQDGKKLFSVGHFDLIIIDESHRSIYRKYKAIFDYFDALMVGLTATPKSDLDKNTYDIFELENNVPTYAYELKNGVNDGFLVYFDLIETHTKFMEQGIHYDELSDEDKEMYEETFDDDGQMPESIESEALNSWLFNDNTIDTVIEMLMKYGLKVESGDKLGKTIIFAKNHRHAMRIVERFDILYPEYNGQFARVIDNYVNYAQNIIDTFSDKNKMPQIAVSVDMMDTGIDVPEILNLVFFKKVLSKSKFWQMIGRGTRLCKDLIGEGFDKEKFYIFDFCNNFEFFRLNIDGKEAGSVMTISERLFNLKVDLVKELQHFDYQQEKYIELRNFLVKELLSDITRLNKVKFDVKQKLRFVEKFGSQESWKCLGELDVKEIKEHLAALIIPSEDDELAKKFDSTMFVIELGHLTGKSKNKEKEKVVRTAEKLSELGTIPQVFAKRETIEVVKKNEFWKSAGLFEFEKVREELRELIKFIQKEDRAIYYTNFTDEVLEINIEEQPEFDVGSMHDYKKKVNAYILEHQDDIAVFKLRNNKRLTKQDYETLERILWKQLGTKDDYQKEFGDTPLTILVREIVGLDQSAANEAFSEFLDKQKLNTAQMRFIKTIVDYVVRNGHLEKKNLQEEPFKSIGSIIALFKTEEQNKIVGIIDEIYGNAIELEGA